jgi:hypothetical protein
MKFEIEPLVRESAPRFCEICRRPAGEAFSLKVLNHHETTMLVGHRECLEDVERTTSAHFQARLAAHDL